MYFKYFILLSLLFVTPALAQKQWTLPEVVEHTLNHNLQVQQTALNSQLSEAELWQSRAAFLPSVNASASHNYSFGRNIDPTTNLYTDQRVQSNGFSLFSNLDIFNGLRLQHNIRRAGLDYRSSLLDLQQLKNEITLNVVAAFLQVLYSRELYENQLEQLEATKLQRERTLRNFEAGNIARSGLLEMDAQLASDEMRAVNARNQLENSVLTLTQIMELPTAENFEIAVPEIEIPEIDLEGYSLAAIFEYAKQHQPEVLSSDLKVKSADKGISVARSALYPRLSLGASINTNYSDAQLRFTGTSLEEIPFNDQIDQNLYKSLGFNLSIPIFNNWQTRTNITRAKINFKIAQLNRQNTLNQLNKNIHLAYQNARAAFQRYLFAQRSVEASEEALKSVEQRLNVGSALQVDFNIAKSNVSNAQTELLQAKYDYIFRIKELDYYQGKPIIF